MSAVAYLFPGQGSQHPGMGRSLVDAFPESRAVFDEADLALGESISDLCFEGTAEQLALTENTQPAILTASVAALRVLETRGVRAVATAGHSLGEYSANVAAGAVDFADAVRTVRLRGRFMQEAVPVGEGAMAAILGLGPDELSVICADFARGEVVSPANFNAPGQVVVAGHAAAVERVIAAAREAGARRAVPLPVSAPFHCALMEPAAQRLKPVLEGIPFHDPAIPVYTNVDAEAARTGSAGRDALVRQVVAPVRWDELVRAMVAQGVDTFLEVGPGRVLSNLVKRAHKAARIWSIEDPEGVERALSELGTSR